MTEKLFDLGEEYEKMLQKGITLSGEDARFFVVGRIQDLRSQLPVGWLPRRILDFGCGIGTASRHLAEAFPGSVITGVDLSEQAVAYATAVNGSEKVRFARLERLAEQAPFDLCYVNGVFHHIRPEDRLEALASIFRALEPGGYIALFENNPWNLGTRMVMKRIPFDRGAVPLSPPETRRILRAAGFLPCGPMRFLFYFPHYLRAFRFFEPWLAFVPLGTQYYQLSRRG